MPGCFWATAVQLLTQERQPTAALENPPWPSKEVGGGSLETGSQRQSPLGWALHFLRKAMWLSSSVRRRGSKAVTFLQRLPPVVPAKPLWAAQK